MILLDVQWKPESGVEGGFAKSRELIVLKQAAIDDRQTVQRIATSLTDIDRGYSPRTKV